MEDDDFISIELQGGHANSRHTIISRSMYDQISRYKWYLSKAGYAFTYDMGRQRVLLHRYVWAISHGCWPVHMIVDHINRDRLDNRVGNLRLCTASDNAKNKTASTTRTLPKGVRKSGNKYTAHITADGVKHKQGPFETVDEAQRAYNQMAIIHHGRFAAPDIRKCDN